MYLLEFWCQFLFPLDERQVIFSWLCFHNAAPGVSVNNKNPRLHHMSANGMSSPIVYGDSWILKNYFKIWGLFFENLAATLFPYPPFSLGLWKKNLHLLSHSHTQSTLAHWFLCHHHLRGHRWIPNGWIHPPHFQPSALTSYFRGKYIWTNVTFLNLLS